MRAWMATAAALALLTGVSTVSAENASAGTNAKSEKAMQSAAPKAKMHHTARAQHVRASETTGAGGRTGTIGGPRNDPSIHQSSGDRDSRDYPKQH